MAIDRRQLRGGEKASLIVKVGEWSLKDAPETEPGDDPIIRMYARPAWVFNVAQVDGYVMPSTMPRLDHALYVSHWLKLKSDSRAIFTASALPAKAVDYLFDLQPKPAEVAS